MSKLKQTVGFLGEEDAGHGVKMSERVGGLEEEISCSWIERERFVPGTRSRPQVATAGSGG